MNKLVSCQKNNAKVIYCTAIFLLNHMIAQSIHRKIMNHEMLKIRRMTPLKSKNLQKSLQLPSYNDPKEISVNTSIPNPLFPSKPIYSIKKI